MKKDEPELVIPLPPREAGMADPLPVTGYTPQPVLKIEAVNRSKELENRLGDFVESLRSSGIADPAWVDDAVRHFQHGFMALNRAVFQPDSRLR